MAPVRELDDVVAVARRAVECAVHTRHQVAGRRRRRPVVGDELGQPHRRARLDLGLHHDPRAVAVGCGLDGAAVDMVLDPDASSSPLLRVASCRTARVPSARDASGTSTFSANPLPRRGSSAVCSGACVTSSELISTRASSSAVTS